MQFQRNDKNVLPSLRQRAGPQRICSRQKSIRSGTARSSFSQTPHMRGKAKGDEFGLGQTRVTPACAGKRGKGNEQSNGNGDHPRMCGEKGLPTLRYSPQSGSPPHVRGKGQSILPLHQRNGITPACAGKRRWPGCSGGSAGDHPRVCGEKSHQRGLGLLLLGSPPHVRGKGVRYLCIVLFAGITPACAGKRSGPLPAAVPAGLAGSCPASRPSQFPPRMTVISPRP